MWFNNVVMYKLETDFTKSEEEIQEALEEHHLKPCPPHARQSQGWVNPFNEIEKKLHSIYGCHILVAAKEMRLLPSSIIQTVLEEKKNAFELTQQRPMRRAEVLQAKEDIEFDLLPKAFCVQKKDWLYIDTVNQWLVFNSSNANKTAEILASLTKALGSLSASPLSPENKLSDLFSTWLCNPQSLPSSLSLQKNCVLVNSKDDKSQYNCKNIEQNLDEITRLIEQGYTVTSLELLWHDRIQFTLTEHFLLKRIKCMDYLEDALQDHKRLDNEQEKFDANFSLFAGEIRGLITFLLSVYESDLVQNSIKISPNNPIQKGLTSQA